MSAATEIYKDMDKETAASTSRGNSFAEEKTLTKHKKTVHTGRLFQCERCPQTFTFLGNLKRHEKIHSQEKRFECQHCSHKFYRKDNLKEHQDVCKRKDKGKRHLEDGAESTNVGESSIKRQKIEDNNTCDHRNSAIEGTLQKFQYKPRTEEKHDLSLTLKDKKNHLHRQLNKQLEAKKGIKWFVSVKAQLVKSNKDGEEIISEPHFRSLCMTSTNPYEIEGQLNEVNGKIISALMAYQNEGSGWTLSQVLQVNLNVAQYSPIKGSSYVPLPKKLRDKKAIVNIKNNDNKCFMWSILASLHSIHSKFNPERVNHYQPFVKELNFDGIEFPVTLDNISKFEKQNCIAINVLGFEDGTLFPSYITKQRFDVHVDLLLYSEGQQNHYCLIRNLNRLLSDQRKHNGTMFHCHYCLHGFVSEDLLQDHQQRCNQHGAQKIELPSEDSMPFMQFKDFHKQLRVPFVIYADFESLTTKIHSVSKEPTLSSTEKYQHHQACGFAYVILSQKPGYCKSPVVYRGEDAVETFLEMLQQEEKQISTILKDIVPMNLTAEDEAQFERATRCHICKEELGADKVRDHCHLSGQFRGAAHHSCNLNFRFTGRIPVILHNMKGYDSHLVMQGLGKIKNKPINCIANNMEKYISFSIGSLDFIDSLQFMNASLEKLVDNLAKEGDIKFQVLKKNIDSDKVPLLLRKGVYPYDYMDSTSKFNESVLPPKEAFYSTLTNEHVSDVDYQHAQTVFQTFQLQNLGEYHDLYLLTDVLLLADVFENFRNICLNYYQLDPAHYYTSPGLAWAACLKMTGVKLKLLTDPDMYLFIEDGLRGGISMISNRYSKANNPYVPDYDPTQDHNYIMYLDANNLYGWAMSQPLPTHDFAWLTEQEIEHFDISEVTENSEDGYILEVDLEYPKELHDSHSDYPLAPEKMKVTSEMLSLYCQQLNEELNLGSASVRKLVPNLNNKTKYILHYRNLQLYLALGMRLTKIHKVLTFAQSTWLKCYIDFNTDKRKQATSDFEKDFFKLMNNSVFGKTMENLRRRVNVKLITNKTQLLKLSASPAFDFFKIFSEDLAAVNMKKTKLYLNRPIYVGFTILDLSKVLMYNFHYNYMMSKYGSCCKLLFTDTDSLCYDVSTQDIYHDFHPDLDVFDTSEYPTDHHLYSSRNKKALGKMKDETHGIPIEEFIGLRPKMYSLKFSENGREVEKKTAKGISKIVTKRDIRHEHYKRCLIEKKRTVNTMKQIRSECHQLYAIQINKIGLSPYDDKRYVLDDGVTTRAYGHYANKM